MEVSKYIPFGNSGYVLITTRNSNNVAHATVGDEEVGEMKPEDAVSLLLKTARADDVSNNEQRSIAMPIAKALGYLALALVHAGSTIHRKICKLGEYLSEYRKHRKEMMMPDSASSADKSKKTIITTWEVSFQRIKSWTTSEAKDAIDLLHIFAFLHNEHIQEVLFEKAWRQSQVQASEQMLYSSYLGPLRALFRGQQKSSGVPTKRPNLLQQAGREWDRLRFHQALALLSDLSLIYWDADRSLCYMHPVIHAWARDRLAPEAHNVWLNVTIDILADSISPNLEPSGRAYRRLLLNHIDSCLEVKNAQTDLQIEDSLDHGSRNLRFASVYAECGRYNSALKIQCRVVALRKRALGSSNEDTLEAMHNLGVTCWNAWRPKEALEVQGEILRLRTRRWAAPSLEGLKAMDDLARTFWLAGNRRESERLGLIAVQGLTRRLGREDPATLNAMHNLGLTSLHLSKPERAVELLEHVYRIRKSFWGYEHDDTLSTMNELSMAYLLLGRQHFAQAETLCRLALEKRMSLLGEEHAYTLWSVNNLSKICCAQDRWDEAVQLLEHIVPVVTRTLGPGHVGMSMTKYNLASAYAGQTYWTKAATMLQQQLQYLTPQHPDWIAYMSLLARVLEHGGQQDEARRICVRAITQYGAERALKSQTPNVIDLVNRLRRLCDQQREGQTEGGDETLLEYLQQTMSTKDMGVT